MYLLTLTSPSRRKGGGGINREYWRGLRTRLVGLTYNFTNAGACKVWGMRSCTMWKSIRSSVRDLLELRVRFTGRKKTEKKMQGRLACLVPSRRACCILRTWEGQSQRAAGESHQHQDAGGRAKTGPDWNVPPIANNNLAETFGWSTAVVVGWYLAHPLTWQTLFGQRRNQQQSSVWWRSFLGRANPLAVPVLPNSESGLQIRASCSSADSHSSVSSLSEHGSSDSVTTDGDEEWPNLRGPFTPLEALDEASREFAAIGRKREANAENEVGLRYMQSGRYRRALRHFQKASFLEHDCAAYNIGQCYELGRGAKRSILKAAQWYKVAAQRGHPTALYNLGVFSFNGWGGMPADEAEARKYFIAAAERGNEQARKALEMVDNTKAPDVSSEVDFNTIPTPTQVLLDMLGVGNEKKTSLTMNTTGEMDVTSLHWLDLSLPVGNKNKSANEHETAAWTGVGNDNLAATCRRFFNNVQNTLNFGNSPTTEAAL